MLAFAIGFAGPAHAQEELVQNVEIALGAANASPVQDMGHLLKPQGRAELEQEAAKLKSDGLNVRFVTVPKGTLDPGALTETVYRDLKLGKEDLLVTFDGQLVYGKSLALQGDKQAFTRAAADAKAGFKLYYARGMKQFADSLNAQILQHRHAEIAARAASEQRVQLIGGVSLTVVVLAIIVMIVRFLKARAAAANAFINKLHHAEKLFERIALKMPDSAPRAVRSRFLRLDEELKKVKESKRTGPARVERLLEDCKALETDLTPVSPKAPQQAEPAAEKSVKLQQLS